jgi:hypothetical protein
MAGKGKASGGGSGRPSVYTEQAAAIILERLAGGKGLKTICDADDALPLDQTVRGWVIDDREGFAARYARARDLGLDRMAEETLEIADTCQPGEKIEETEGKDGETTTKRLTADMIEHRRLRVDVRKWYLSKIAPKRYGDRLAQEHSGPDGQPLGPLVNVYPVVELPENGRGEK